MSDDEIKKAPPGPLQRLAASFLGLMQSHLGLFSIELEETRERLIKTLVLVIVGAGAIVLCLLTVTLAVILMVDEAHRLYAVLGLLAFFIVLALACLGAAWYGVKHGPEPFAMTREELRRDRERLLP
ncbi:MAG TPA: phage holin family protein [Arenimonas sp.]|uniref:phage holin family protein n=1 Tax=Arenimonas sp. TaxID=1872635 RepID=UPI002C45D616|nr:phage holin family protein [Arenimonas sp.]HMB56506.1 phage holin family protein [Arenimonas sp.]